MTYKIVITYVGDGSRFWFKKLLVHFLKKGGLDVCEISSSMDLELLG